MKEEGHRRRSKLESGSTERDALSSRNIARDCKSRDHVIVLERSLKCGASEKIFMHPYRKTTLAGMLGKNLLPVPRKSSTSPSKGFK